MGEGPRSTTSHEDRRPRRWRRGARRAGEAKTCAGAPVRRFVCLSLIAALAFNPAWAAGVPAASAVPEPAVKTGAPPNDYSKRDLSSNPVAPAPAAVGVKEPAIEVSVDTLEISESDESRLGFLWTQSINFIERSIPSVISVGTLVRNPTSPIFAQLQALITNNQVRILANPSILTKSGFEATFLVGGEIPYPQVGQGGVSGVDYKKYGVSLKILPQLTPRNTVDAQITAGVSAPDDSVAQIINGTSVPGLSNREASTRVEVRDGDTVVLAGIKQSRREKAVTKVPILGYIPILGLLFRHKREKTSNVSLVFFVTFKLIK